MEDFAVVFLWSFIVLLSCSHSSAQNEDFFHQVTLSSSGSSNPIEAGQQHVLNCTADYDFILPNLTLLEVTWLDSNNHPIINSTMISITGDTVTAENFLSSQLTFNPLRPSQGGSYTCVVKMTIADFNITDRSVNETMDVVVRLKQPFGGVNLSRSGTLYAGTSIEIICLIKIMDREVTDVDLQANIRLIPSRQQNRVMVGNVAQVNDTTFALNVTYRVLSSDDRVGPQFIANICPLQSSTFVECSTTEHIIIGNEGLRTESLPPPMIMFYTMPNTPVIAGKQLNLFCIAIVEEHLVVQPTINWLYSNGSVINSDENINIQSITKISSTEFRGVLTFNNFLTSYGGEYKCEVNITVPEISLLETNEDTFTLTVTVPEPAVNVALSSPPPVIPLYVGRTEITNITCSASLETNRYVNTREGIHFTFMWLDINGEEISDTNNPRVIIGSPTPSSSVLTLLSLSAHDTNITCVVEASSPLNQYIQFNDPGMVTNHLIIHIPPPTLNISFSPTEAHVFIGLDLNLTCYIQLDVPLEHSMFTLSNVWSKSGSILTTSDRVTVEENPVKLSPLLYYTSLIVSDFNENGDDDGNYSCFVNITSDNSLIVGASMVSTRYIFTEAVDFQFDVVNTVLGCTQWRVTDGKEKVDDIVTKLVYVLNEECECGLTNEHITDHQLYCPYTNKTVVFRAKLHGTSKSPADELIHYLKAWISSEESMILISLVQHHVQNFCTETVNSTIEEECIPDATTTRALQPAAEDDRLMVTIAGGAVAVLITLILAVVIGIVVCVIANNYSKARRRPTVTPREGGQIQMNTLNQRNSICNDYEEIGKYSDIFYSEISDKSNYATIPALKISVGEDYTYTQYVPMAPVRSVIGVSSEVDEDGYETIKAMQ